MARHFRGHWNLENTKRWVEMFERQRMPAVEIGKAVDADPSTVTTWLKRHGVTVYAGLHRTDRRQPNVSSELVSLLSKSIDEISRLLYNLVWGISVTEDGLEQLTKFCDFLRLPLQVGVNEAAERLGIHRDVVREWTLGTDRPYLVKIVDAILTNQMPAGFKLLPRRVEAGGNKLLDWIRVPTTIRSKEDVQEVLRQIRPLEETYTRTQRFGIPLTKVETMRAEFFAYLLGMALGDSGKEGGRLQRFTSSNLDLVLSKKHPSNERLGEFTCMCANSLGIEMGRIKDKAPTGDTLEADHPWDSFRWTSERSPLIAWMMAVGLGISDGQTTSNNAVHMDWIFDMPHDFRKRFVQALADSDGTARSSVVEIASLPNAEFTTHLLHSLGITSAFTRMENGVPMRSVMKSREAAKLPVFSEFVQSYRYRVIAKYIEN